MRTLPRFDYLGCVSRAATRGVAQLYGFTVRDRLPRVKLPLRGDDPDIVLDLPAAMAAGYEEAPIRCV